MTFVKTVFVDLSNATKVTATWLNALQDWLLAHKTQHATGGADALTASDIGAASTTQYKYIPLPADSWRVGPPPSEGGTGATLIQEPLTNGIERVYLGFTHTAAQNAYCIFNMPENWNGGNLTLVHEWETASADGNTCEMEIYGDRIGDNETSDVALSTLLTSITDTNNGAGKNNKSAETGTFMIAGTGKKIRLRMTRDYTTDTLEAAIKSFGLVLKCIVTES
jgi:hypothetical protein